MSSPKPAPATSSGGAGHRVAPIPFSGGSNSTLQAVMGALGELPKWVNLGSEKDQSKGFDKVMWSRFDIRGDVPVHGTLLQNIKPLLLLGYSGGFQAWDVSSDKNAVEILSFRTETMLCAKVLEPPGYNNSGQPDRLATNRPVLAFSSTTSRSTVQFMEMATANVLNIPLHHDDPILELDCNADVIVVATEKCIFVYDSLSLTNKHRIMDTLPVPRELKGTVINPFSLGPRWLAYASSKPIGIENRGGLQEESTGSLVTDAVGLVQRTSKDLWLYGGAKLQTVSDMVNRPSSHPSRAQQTSSGVSRNNVGIVKIVAVGQNDVADMDPVFHFRAHRDPRFVTLLKFNHDGTILVTADSSGQHVHVFNLAFVEKKYNDMARYWSSSHATPTQRPNAVAQHIYTLRRGITTGWIRDLAFSPDSRWISFTSDRATVHIFPISPRGGPVSKRTHIRGNIASSGRFAASSGLNELPLEQRPVLLDGALLKLKFKSDKDVQETDVDPMKLATQTIPQHVIVPGHVSLHFGSDDKTKDFNSTEDQQHGHTMNMYVATTEGKMVLYKLQPSVAQRSTDSTATESGGGAENGSSFLGMIAQQIIQTGSGPSPRDPEQIGVSCESSMLWELCREKNWPDVTRQITSSRSTMPRQQRAPTPNIDDANNNAEWLSKLEIRTHQDGQRKVWMGPQFEFRPYDDASSRPSSNNRNGKMKASRRPLQVKNRMKNREQLSKSPIISLSAGLVASSWPDSPIIHIPATSSKSKPSSSPSNGNPDSLVRDALQEAMRFDVESPEYSTEDFGQSSDQGEESDTEADWSEDTMFTMEQPNLSFNPQTQ